MVLLGSILNIKKKKKKGRKSLGEDPLKKVQELHIGYCMGLCVEGLGVTRDMSS